ncbi:MAG: ASCH domain-containing protein [Thermoproteales archaeon]|nr:ASCH domain-containing protein [Thermoproteales archaeon]
MSMIKRRLGRYLTFKPKYLRRVLSSSKTATIRLGLVKPMYRRVYIESCGRLYGEALISRVRHLRLSDLREEDAVKDGFHSLHDMLRELEAIYPTIKPSDWVTVIEFELLEKFEPPVDKRLAVKGAAQIARLALAYNAYRDARERLVLASLAAGEGLIEAAEGCGLSLGKVLEILRAARDRLRLMGCAPPPS